jgi:hypothetical protein
MNSSSYDIIGDIHGHARKLERLLRHLGYRETRDAWRHPDRTAVFVGDFIDRGPEQLRTIDIARRMVDAGSARAVMGNHELNAIAWHTPHPKQPGSFLRPHDGPWGEKNRVQHEAFLTEIGERPTLHEEVVDWFLTLPLWIEFPLFRVVHACWHTPFIKWLKPQLRGGAYLTRELMMPATQEPADRAEKDTETPSVFKAVEAVTKGIEIPLPDGLQFIDKDRHVRTRVRVRWWDRDAATYRSGAMWDQDSRGDLPESPLPSHARLTLPDVPVFFGHYWLTGTPMLQAAMATCVDYSAGKGGPLVAYRFDGEPSLTTDHLVWVD